MVAALAAPQPRVLTREPRGAALDLLYDRAPELLIEGPAGTGKTLACLTKLHICLGRNYPGARALMARKTRESLTESALVEFEDRCLIGRAAPIKRGPDRARRQRYTYPNGSELVIGGMDKSSKIMSTQYDLIYVPEATELTEDDWENLTTRNRNNIMPYQQMIADCNPGPPTHWLNQRADRGGMVRLLSRHRDNPRYWDEERAAWTQEGQRYVNGTLARLGGVRRARLFEGRWAAAEGMVYEQWDATVHLVDAAELRARGIIE